MTISKYISDEMAAINTLHTLHEMCSPTLAYEHTLHYCSLSKATRLSSVHTVCVELLLGAHGTWKNHFSVVRWTGQFNTGGSHQVDHRRVSVGLASRDCFSVLVHADGNRARMCMSRKIRF